MSPKPTYIASSSSAFADGRILVTIPHQMPAKAYGFNSLEDALKTMERVHVSDGFSVQHFSRAEWDAHIVEVWGDDWRADPQAVAWHGVGASLFDAGNERIVERCSNNHSAAEIVAKKEHDQLKFLLQEIGRDLHACYFFDREEALRLIVDGQEGAYSHHQFFAMRRALVQEACSLQWVEPKPEPRYRIEQTFETLGASSPEYAVTEAEAVTVREEIVRKVAEMIAADEHGMGAGEELDEHGQPNRSGRTGIARELEAWDAAHDAAGPGKPLTVEAARIVAEAAVTIEALDSDVGEEAPDR